MNQNQVQTGTAVHFPQTAKESVKEFEDLCEKAGVYWQIGWCWSGWNRDGVLCLESSENKTLFKQKYARNTTLWYRGDEQLKRIHTGHPKHETVLDAIAFLKKHLSQTH